MPILLDDISRRVDESFVIADRPTAVALLSDAVIHDGTAAGPRLQRCALVVSKGSLEKLRYYVALLKDDYRDVIVAGEHDSINDEPVRDLSRPFE
jgi:hypothetical protein